MTFHLIMCVNIMFSSVWVAELLKFLGKSCSFGRPYVSMCFEYL